MALHLRGETSRDVAEAYANVMNAPPTDGIQNFMVGAKVVADLRTKGSANAAIAFFGPPTDPIAPDNPDVAAALVAAKVPSSCRRCSDYPGRAPRPGAWCWPEPGRLHRPRPGRGLLRPPRREALRCRYLWHGRALPGAVDRRYDRDAEQGELDRQVWRGPRRQAAGSARSNPDGREPRAHCRGPLQARERRQQRLDRDCRAPQAGFLGATPVDGLTRVEVDNLPLFPTDPAQPGTHPRPWLSSARCFWTLPAGA
jgi:hypothetical protein